MPLLPSSNGLVMQASLASMRDLEAQTASLELLPEVLDNPRLELTTATTTYRVLDETTRTTSAESESPKIRKVGSTGGRSSVRSVDGRRPGGHLCKASTTSLQSLVRRKSRRHTAASSLPLETELSTTYTSSYRPYNTVDLPKASVAEALQCRAEEETTANTPTSSLYYSSTRRHSSMKNEGEPREPICTSTATGTAATSVASSANAVHTPHVTYGANNQVILATATTSLTAGPSTSSWNNSGEQETAEYVVDPAQGNAYYKGQFLGKGGFARVYLMTDVSNGNRYACKIIPKNRMHKIHMQKIAREIMIHKELNHVNVVQMHHYFEDNLNVYMLLEACPRKSLMHVLKYRGKVTEPEARYYMKQMVTGVAYIHSQRVVHRDLKPGNMFLSDRMIVKIGDFGLATRPDGQRRRVTICGTPNYIAPEVLYKQAYSYEADVWALGCILYALLVGQPPFDTATLNETYARICSNQYRELDDTIATRNGQDLIKSLLQLNPQLRPSLERVKEHAYLTKEFVPNTLPHSCCYQMPHSGIIDPASSSPSSTSTTSRSRTLRKRQSLGQMDGSLRRPDQYHPRHHHHYNQQQQSQQPPHQHPPPVPLDPVEPLRSRQIHSPTRSQKNQPKKSKVSSWLVRKLPKLPKFRQRLTSVLCPDGKKPGAASQSVDMHRALEECVSELTRYAAQNPPIAENVSPLFVTKWIDYSNKYGLGFQLSDRSVGVLFNDNTKISYTHDRRRVEYMTTDDELTRYHRERDVPVPLQEKLDILRHFAQYMDNFLTEGGERRDYRGNRKNGKNSKNACVPRMRRWLRTDKAIVMELTVPLLQVNFFVDHTKMVVSQESPGRGYLITYIDTGRHAFSYWLEDLRLFGCTADLYDRLYYVSKVTREFAELDNNMLA